MAVYGPIVRNGVYDMRNRGTPVLGRGGRPLLAQDYTFTLRCAASAASVPVVQPIVTCNSVEPMSRLETYWVDRHGHRVDPEVDEWDEGWREITREIRWWQASVSKTTSSETMDVALTGPAAWGANVHVGPYAGGDCSRPRLFHGNQSRAGGEARVLPVVPVDPQRSAVASIGDVLVFSPGWTTGIPESGVPQWMAEDLAGIAPVGEWFAVADAYVAFEASANVDPWVDLPDDYEQWSTDLAVEATGFDGIATAFTGGHAANSACVAGLFVSGCPHRMHGGISFAFREAFAEDAPDVQPTATEAASSGADLAAACEAMLRGLSISIDVGPAT